MNSLIFLCFIWSKALLDFYKYLDFLYLGSRYFIRSSLFAIGGNNLATSWYLAKMYSLPFSHLRMICIVSATCP